MKNKKLLLSIFACFLLCPLAINEKSLNIEYDRKSLSIFGSAGSGTSIGTGNLVKPTSISISESLSLNIDDDSSKLIVMYLPSNTSSKYKNVLWLSSDKSIATVDSNGYVTPVNLGTTTISASVMVDKSYVLVSKCQVTVTAEEENFKLQYCDEESFNNLLKYVEENNESGIENIVLNNYKDLPSELNLEYDDSKENFIELVTYGNNKHNYSFDVSDESLFEISENDYGYKLSWNNRGSGSITINDKVNSYVQKTIINLNLFEVEKQKKIFFMNDGVDENELTDKYTYYSDYNKITDIEFKLFKSNINSRALGGIEEIPSNFTNLFETTNSLTPNIKKVKSFYNDIDLWNFIPQESKLIELNLTGTVNSYANCEEDFKLNVTVFKAIELNQTTDYQLVKDVSFGKIDDSILASMSFECSEKERYVIRISEDHMLKNTGDYFKYIDFDYLFTLKSF